MNRPLHVVHVQGAHCQRGSHRVRRHRWTTIDSVIIISVVVVVAVANNSHGGHRKGTTTGWTAALPANPHHRGGMRLLRSFAGARLQAAVAHDGSATLLERAGERRLTSHRGLLATLVVRVRRHFIRVVLRLGTAGQAGQFTGES